MKKKLIISFKQTLALALALSVFLHILFGGGLYLLTSKSLVEKKEPVEIVVLDQKEYKKRMQIVDQSKKRLNNEIPEDTQFLSRHNQRVVKETKAHSSGKFINTNSTGQQGAQQKPQQKATAKKQAHKTRQKAALNPQLKDLTPQFDFAPSPKQTQEPQKQASLQSQTEDHLKKVKSSLETLLNTREFKYFSYYQRIRNKIRQYWEPSIKKKVQKIFQQGRTIASTRDRITKVVLILDPSGTLINIKVIGQSGLTDLDDAAIEAFRAAEPFPNPPKGIIGSDGTITIRWDFILEARLELIRKIESKRLS